MDVSANGKRKQGVANLNTSNYRKVYLEENGESCELCSSEESVVVHHIDGDRENNIRENLMAVCRGCHTKIHFGSEYRHLYEKLPDASKFGVSECVGSKSSPAFPYENTKQGPIYPRDETWGEFDDVLDLDVRRILREDGYRGIEKRELHEATLRLAIERPDQVAEQLEELREGK